MVRESDKSNKANLALDDKARIVSNDGKSLNALFSEVKELIETGTAVPFIMVVSIGDDKGLIVTEQFSVGSPGSPKESVFGSGDSYGVGLEDTTPDGIPVPGSGWHCTMDNTTGLTIVSAVDITTELASDAGSEVLLFDGEVVGKYILVGSEYSFGGAKVKITTPGIIEPGNVVAEFLADATPTWVEAKFMATKANFPYTQLGPLLASEAGSEQWRFGFDPTGPVPPVWDKVTLNINGTDYTKHWARFRIAQTITSDPTVEQIKLHTNRFEINSDGKLERFGISRCPKTLISGVENLIANDVDSPANQNVVYESGECIADYRDNRLNDGAVDTTLLIQNIENGIDTSIPLVLDISYYADGPNTGDIEWTLDIYDVSDGFVYDGSAVPRTYKTIDTIDSPSEDVRRTISLTIPINMLTNDDAIVIKIKRDATLTSDDTLAENVVLTNVRLTGYFWC